MSRALFAVLALTSACSLQTTQHALRYVATGTEIAAQGSLVCDAGSTHAAVSYGHGITETNPVMGEHPTDGTIGVYFVGAGAVVAGYNRVLPDILRIAANVMVIGAEVAAVDGNRQWHGGMCGL